MLFVEMYRILTCMQTQKVVSSFYALILLWKIKAELTIINCPICLTGLPSPLSITPSPHSSSPPPFSYPSPYHLPFPHITTFSLSPLLSSYHLSLLLSEHSCKPFLSPSYTPSPFIQPTTPPLRSSAFHSSFLISSPPSPSSSSSPSPP